MAGTNAYAAKRVLVDQLAALPGLASVNVVYSWSGKVAESDRELIVPGDRIAGPIQLAAMAAGGRLQRAEDLSFPLHVVVYQPDAEDGAPVEARATELGTLVEEHVAGNPTLGVPGLHKTVLVNFDMQSSQLDEGWFTDLVYTVTFSSHIR